MAAGVSVDAASQSFRSGAAYQAQLVSSALKILGHDLLDIGNSAHRGHHQRGRHVNASRSLAIVAGGFKRSGAGVFPRNKWDTEGQREIGDGLNHLVQVPGDVGPHPRRIEVVAQHHLAVIGSRHDGLGDGFDHHQLGHSGGINVAIKRIERHRGDDAIRTHLADAMIEEVCDKQVTLWVDDHTGGIVQTRRCRWTAIAAERLNAIARDGGDDPIDVRRAAAAAVAEA